MTLIVFDKTNEFPSEYYNDEFNLIGYTEIAIRYNISKIYWDKLSSYTYHEMLLIIRRLKINKLKNINYKESTFDKLLTYVYFNRNKISYDVSKK